MNEFNTFLGRALGLVVLVAAKAEEEEEALLLLCFSRQMATQLTKLF
jgi:hypothetical protein